MKRNSNTETSKPMIYLKGAIIGLIAFAASLFIFAALLLLGVDRSFAAPMATVSLAIGSFAASFYSALKIGNKGYLAGLIVGACVFGFITAVALIVSKGAVGYNTLFHFIIVMLSSLAGGIAGVNKKTSKKYI